MPEVIALGDINLDLVAYISEFPPLGGDQIARNLLVRSGGSAANTALALARCGVSAGLIGSVGADVIGDWVLNELSVAGVDLSQVQRDPYASGGLIFVAVTPDGQRTMFSHRGANTGIQPYSLRPEAIGRAQWLHLSGYALLESPQAEVLLRALVIARHKGCSVSLDPGPELVRRKPAAVKAILPYVTTLFLNRDEFQALTGTSEPSLAVSELGRRGQPIVALKLGEHGCVLGQGDKMCHIPGFTVDAIDTTGAGDAFAAGFLAGAVRGLSLHACGLWGNAMGALVISAGGSTSLGPSSIASLLRDSTRQTGWRAWRSEIEAILGTLNDATRNGEIALC